eukprot:Opistho-2@86517
MVGDGVVIIQCNGLLHDACRRHINLPVVACSRDLHARLLRIKSKLACGQTVVVERIGKLLRPIHVILHRIDGQVLALPVLSAGGRGRRSSTTIIRPVRLVALDDNHLNVALQTLAQSARSFAWKDKLNAAFCEDERDHGCNGILRPLLDHGEGPVLDLFVAIRSKKDLIVRHAQQRLPLCVLLHARKPLDAKRRKSRPQLHKAVFGINLAGTSQRLVLAVDLLDEWLELVHARQNRLTRCVEKVECVLSFVEVPKQNLALHCSQFAQLRLLRVELPVEILCLRLMIEQIETDAVVARQIQLVKIPVLHKHAVVLAQSLRRNALGGRQPRLVSAE